MSAHRRTLNAHEDKVPENFYFLGSPAPADAADLLSSPKIQQILSADSNNASADDTALSAEGLPTGAVGAALLGTLQEVSPPEPGPLDNLDKRFKADPDYALKNGPAIVGALRKLPPLEQALELEHPAFHKRRTLFRQLLKGQEAVKKETDGQGSAVAFEDPEPWDEPVPGAALANAIRRFFDEHLVSPKPEIPDLLALWAVFTWCPEHFRHRPRLAITSAEKGSGKTTLLDCLELVIFRPVNAANITASVIFRMMEKNRISLLMDEVDASGISEEKRGILNAGHKRGGQVFRSVGEDFEPRGFICDRPVAFAGIGKKSIPDTLRDRAFEISLKKAKSHEQLKPLDEDAEAEAKVLTRKIMRWVQDNGEAIAVARPILPGHFFNRKGDNYRVLFTLAQVIGGDWWQRVIRIEEALRPQDEDEEDDRFPHMLLRSLKRIFDLQSDPENAALSSDHILEQLANMTDMPWSDMPRSHKPITNREFWRLLKEYDIRATQIQVRSHNLRGLKYVNCADAFERYLTTSAANPGPSAEALLESADGILAKMQQVSRSAASAGAGEPQKNKFSGSAKRDDLPISAEEHMRLRRLMNEKRRPFAELRQREAKQ